MKIKLCGFTREQDVRAALDLGVDAIGLNLARGPRKVTVERAAVLARLIPTSVMAVALFVDADEATILAALTATTCTVVQLHGDEPPALAERRRTPARRQQFRAGAPSTRSVVSVSASYARRAQPSPRVEDGRALPCPPLYQASATATRNDRVRGASAHPPATMDLDR